MKEKQVLLEILGVISDDNSVIIFFLFLYINICCGYSFDVPQEAALTFIVC